MRTCYGRGMRKMRVQTPIPLGNGSTKAEQLQEWTMTR